MSVSISIQNGVRIVHLRGPAEDPLTEKLAQFITYSLSREDKALPRKRTGGR
jgi:hypothetical protein